MNSKSIAGINMTRVARMYRNLEIVLGGFDLIPDAAQIENPPYMKLSLDRLPQDRERTVIALAHNYIMNGDVVPDPDMTMAIDRTNKTVEALTYQDISRYDVVYPEPGRYSPGLKKSLNQFLDMWLKNLVSQGFRFNFK